MDLKNELPLHIGIIMDGNGRWARQRNMPRNFGHKEGVERVLDIVRSCYKMNIPYVSLYAFSTENWKRPKQEISNLMFLLQTFIDQYLNELHENGVKLNIMGELDPFSDKIKAKIENAVDRTKNNTKLHLNIGLNYGGQDEIIRATRMIAEEVQAGRLRPEEIDRHIFEKHLYTCGQPPLDLLIRPSGELRVSNFMLYQLAYAEFWFSDVLWPDFTPDILEKAISDYQRRDRRFGGV